MDDQHLAVQEKNLGLKPGKTFEPGASQMIFEGLPWLLHRMLPRKRPTFAGQAGADNRLSFQIAPATILQK